MKIRTGFVSNSSSSSFCIYGKWLEKKELKQLEDFVEDKNIIEIHHTGHGIYAGAYVGRSYESIKDDETGKQFKTSVDEVIKSAFGYKMNLDTHKFKKDYY
jgi:hypothetical protein